MNALLPIDVFASVDNNIATITIITGSVRNIEYKNDDNIWTVINKVPGSGFYWELEWDIVKEDIVKEDIVKIHNITKDTFIRINDSFVIHVGGIMDKLSN